MTEDTSAMPKGAKAAFEAPEAFRRITEKSAAQTKEMYERMKVAADEATDLLENSLKTAAAGITEHDRKLIENARSNASANFDHVIALFGAKSLSEAIEMSNMHARKQYELVAEQAKELAALHTR
jgi:phasin